MLIYFLIATFFIQVLLYLLCDKLRFPKAKYLVLIAFIAGHILFFPSYFTPVIESDEGICLLPFFAVHILFVLVGFFGSILIHFIYIMLKKTWYAPWKIGSNEASENSIK